MATAACSAGSSMSNQRLRGEFAVRAACGLMAMISKYASGLDGVAILNNRLCVP